MAEFEIPVVLELENHVHCFSGGSYCRCPWSVIMTWFQHTKVHLLRELTRRQANHYTLQLPTVTVTHIQSSSQLQWPRCCSLPMCSEEHNCTRQPLVSLQHPHPLSPVIGCEAQIRPFLLYCQSGKERFRPSHTARASKWRLRCLVLRCVSVFTSNFNLVADMWFSLSFLQKSSSMCGKGCLQDGILIPLAIGALLLVAIQYRKKSVSLCSRTKVGDIHTRQGCD